MDLNLVVARTLTLRCSPSLAFGAARLLPLTACGEGPAEPPFHTLRPAETPQLTVPSSACGEGRWGRPLFASPEKPGEVDRRSSAHFKGVTAGKVAVAI